jgi:protein SCO1
MPMHSSFFRLSILSILVIACGAASAHHENAQRTDRSLQNWPLERFTLFDQHGRKFTQEQLMGRWTFVVMGDTRCAQPCTDALATLDGLVKRIYRTEAALTTQVLFISLDPARDTQERLLKYLAPYDKRWIAATGSADTLKQLADDLGLAGKSHGAVLALVSPQGFLDAEYAAPFDVKRLTADYLKGRVRR